MGFTLNSAVSCDGQRSAQIFVSINTKRLSCANAVTLLNRCNTHKCAVAFTISCNVWVVTGATLSREMWRGTCHSSSAHTPLPSAIRPLQAAIIHWPPSCYSSITKEGEERLRSYGTGAPWWNTLHEGLSMSTLLGGPVYYCSMRKADDKKQGVNALLECRNYLHFFVESVVPDIARMLQHNEGDSTFLQKWNAIRIVLFFYWCMCARLKKRKAKHNSAEMSQCVSQ